MPPTRLHQTAFSGDEVVTTTRIDAVVTRPTPQVTVAAGTAHHVGEQGALDGLGPVDRVGAGPGDDTALETDPVDPRAVGEEVALGTPLDAVVTGAFVDEVLALATADDVVAVAAVERVLAGAADEPVVVVTAGHPVGARASVDDVVASVAANEVLAGPTAHHVVTVAPEEGVVALAEHHHVGERRTDR